MVAFFTDIFARLAFKNTIFIAKWQRHTIVWRHFSMLVSYKSSSSSSAAAFNSNNSNNLSSFSPAKEIVYN